MYHMRAKDLKTNGLLNLLVTISIMVVIGMFAPLHQLLLLGLFWSQTQLHSPLALRIMMKT
jgi:hypothetical protein